MRGKEAGGVTNTSAPHPTEGEGDGERRGGEEIGVAESECRCVCSFCFVLPKLVLAKLVLLNEVYL